MYGAQNNDFDIKAVGMLIKIDVFGGLIPKVAPHLLPLGKATVAENVNISSGELRPIKDYLIEETVPNSTQTIYKHASGWLKWSNDVDVVRCPVGGNIYDRIYTSGDGYPKATDSQLYPTWYKLGLPENVPAPTVTIIGSATGDFIESRTYCYTYVREWSDGKVDESAPSLPSETVDVYEGQDVLIDNFSPSPGDAGITKIRIYRSNTGSSGDAIWQFVEEIPYSLSAQYTDSKTSDNLGEQLMTQGWSLPPEDLKGLTVLPGGFLAGFTQNEICFSETYQPHAWPQKYRLSVDYPIVAIARLGGIGLAVLTEQYPYICVGNAPESMSLERINSSFPCSSKRGAKEYENGVIYPSPDGLVLITNAGAQLLTKDIVDRRAWQDFLPINTAVIYDGRYYGFGGSNIVFDIRDGGKLSTLDIAARAAFVDEQQDILYLTVPYTSLADAIAQWETADTYKSFTWRSGKFNLQHNNMAAGIVIADEPVQFIYTADNTIIFNNTVQPNSVFRLPSGYRGRWGQIEIRGQTFVQEVALATSIAELRLI